MVPLMMLSIFPAALLIAAANDLYEFKIPNWISVVLFAAYFAGGLALGAPAALYLEGLLLAAAALAVGFALFAFRILGGGDAKLLAAIAPWIGLSGLGAFLVNMAFAGAALAVALILFRKTPLLPIYAHAPWIMRLHQQPKDIPYAVAIAAGGLLSFPQTPYFQLAYGG
ncbi:A24 family peptidase [Amphiplicatus metriothermophilus]|uniref:Prepilin peptidase CpaA n=1 Tax=Amphiplicatus metriothermophilus TaxID=1519374 RepID=A0A239PIQ2_9PROT|nr:prepilin peptidase [Amphiplicatus metriothermophilus]MBB5518000.1 prepilin peptidase CpaA [Amphiplicatus metriothermophilus]SNT67666.1 prepilin peptidase CpaA [Amphiplicatus metriothermophilus]